jgi:hypothetical protein
MDGLEFTAWSHSISAIFGGLVRANFRVDAMLEPEPLPAGSRSPFWHDAAKVAPRTLVVRARKEGS